MRWSMRRRAKDGIGRSATALLTELDRHGPLGVSPRRALVIDARAVQRYLLKLREMRDLRPPRAAA
jgi:hypothetical protein